jgi:hypothetical protein
MPTKNTSRMVWLLVLAAIAFLFLYVSFAGRPRKAQPQDEFPASQPPPPPST